MVYVPGKAVESREELLEKAEPSRKKNKMANIKLDHVELSQAYNRNFVLDIYLRKPSEDKPSLGGEMKDNNLQGLARTASGYLNIDNREQVLNRVKGGSSPTLGTLYPVDKQFADEFWKLYKQLRSRRK